MIQRYVSKISGPLLDRIDIHIDVPAVNYKEMRSTKEAESSASILGRVVRARDVQLKRLACLQQKLYCNAQMPTQLIRKFCELSADCERLLERAMAQQGNAGPHLLGVSLALSSAASSSGLSFTFSTPP